MTYDDLAGAVLCNLDDTLALLKIRGDRLFHQDIIALFKRRNGVVDVLAVHGGNDHDIGKLILREHFLCAREAKLILDAVELFRFLYLFRVDIRHGDDLHAVREKLLHGSVCAAAVAEAGDGKCDGCFHGFYPLFLS